MKEKNNKIKVRIAPSPTGHLHVGTARTALFNYLFAKSNNGKFLLRIEDTDILRSKTRMVKSIIGGLEWMGLDWDEDILYQSDHFDEYRRKSEELIEKGFAYWCYCKDEEIEKRKRESIKESKKWKYDRKCYNLSEEEKNRFAKEGRPRALRFFIPEGFTTYSDLIHGDIRVDNSEIEDFVLIKSDGSPTYNFAVVIDDNRMRITHVIRGDDHISNTPKQIILYEAFDWEIPEFGHIPLILGKDRSKLSKRHGAVSISNYRDEGFLPEAFVNHLAFLGWSPKTEEEIFSLNDLIKRFSIKNVNIKSAVFDIERLEWLNREWMNKLGSDEISKRLRKFLKEREINVRNGEYLKRVIDAMGNRVRKFRDFIDVCGYFFTDKFDYDKKGLEKHSHPELNERIRMLIERLMELDSFNKDSLEDVLRDLSGELNCKAADLIHPVRLGISGMTFGPGLFELMEVLGRDVVIKRLKTFVDYLEGGIR